MACLNDIVLYNHLPLSHPLSQSKFEDTAIPQPSYNYQCNSIIQGGSTTIANGLWHEVIPSIIAILFGMVCSLMLPSLREKGSLLATPIHTALASAIVETEGSSPPPLPARGEGANRSGRWWMRRAWSVSLVPGVVPGGASTLVVHGLRAVPPG
jgi:hypothetical protein